MFCGLRVPVVWCACLGGFCGLLDCCLRGYFIVALIVCGFDCCMLYRLLTVLLFGFCVVGLICCV